MSPTDWRLLLLPLLVVLWLRRRTRRSAGFYRGARRRREKRGKPMMEEIVLKLMGKGVQVSTINDTLTGRLTHYAQGWRAQ